jgi:hypothetical protein
MSIFGQNVLTETVEYLDAGSIFDAVVTKKIAALNTSTQSNIDLFIGATGNINMNVRGYNVLRFQEKENDNKKTTQVYALNTQPLEIIPGDSDRTAIISDMTFTQTTTKQQIKSKKGILVLDDDIEVTGSLTLGQDFLVGGALIGASMNTMRSFDGISIGFGWRVDDQSNLELYKFDNTTNATKKILTYGVGEVGSNQDTNSFPVYGSNAVNNPNGVTYAPNQSDNFWSSNGTDIYFTSGRIGVGTTMPAHTGHFEGEVYAKNGFLDGLTVIKDGSISTPNTITGAYIIGDGSLLSNLTAANITGGKLQTSLIPNIIDTKEVYTDTLSAARVDVTGDINFDGNLYQNGELFSGGGGSFLSYNASNNSVYYTAGNIGIGTTNPLVALQVDGTSAIKIPVGTTSQRPDNSVGGGMLRYNTTTSQYEGFSGSTWTGLGGVTDVNQDTYISAETSAGANNDQLKFFTSNVQRMIINNTGNIGIGTTSPLGIVHIQNKSTIPSLFLNNGDTTNIFTAPQIQFGYNGSNIYNHFIHTRHVSGTGVNNSIDFYCCSGTTNNTLSTGSTQVMTLEGTGNVGIGTTIPAAKLHIHNSSSAASLLVNNGEGYTSFTNPQIQFGYQGTTQYSHFIHSRHYGGNAPGNCLDFYICTGTAANTISTGSINVMTLEGSGYVGIGITNPSYKIDVNGTARIIGATTLSSTLGVSGATTLSSTLGVTGVTTLSSTLGVTGATTLSSTLGVTGATTLSSTLSVTNAVALSNVLSVTGNTTLNSNVYIPTGKLGVGTNSPQVSLDIVGTDALKVPVGTTAQRPGTTGIGMLRYNTTTSQYEGYANNNWTGLGGVVDVNQDTYISAETTPGANNDELKFYTGANQRMIINSAGKLGIGTTSPLYSVDIYGTTRINSNLIINDTSAITVPIGSTLQRPIESNIGMIRYNTDTNSYEGFANSNWSAIAGSSTSYWTESIVNSNIYYELGGIGIGVTDNLDFSLKVSNCNQSFSVCSSNETGNMLELSSILTGPKLIVDSLGNTTTKGILKVNKSSDSYNLTASNVDLLSVMGITDYYLNISTLSLPSNISKYNNNLLYTVENIEVEFKADNISKMLVSSSISNNSVSYINSSSTIYKTVTINSNNYFTFVGENLSYDINILRNINTAKLGIGITSDLEKSLEVSGDTSITGNLFLNSGGLYIDGVLLNTSTSTASVFQTTSSNVYYTGHTSTITEVYNTSNSVYTTDNNTIFGITTKFLDLSLLNFPNTLPVTYENNYILKATKNLTITLTANVDGSTAYVSDSITNVPLFTYIADPNTNNIITIPQNYYLAVVGI